LFVALVAVLAGVVSSAGFGQRTPTRGEREALTATVVTYVDTAADGCCVRGLRAKVIAMRLSTISPSWAVVTISARYSSGKPAQGAALLMFFAGSAWTVKDLGSILDGCGVPTKVRKDLQLTCPSP
jgi:hypothetical protein